MKKYLFGLGAMLLGAGLMFVFTHTNVEAGYTKGTSCTNYDVSINGHRVKYCKIEDLTCAITGQGISCVKN